MTDASRQYDPKKVTVYEAAVIEAITASMDSADAVSEARTFIEALKAQGLLIIHDPNRRHPPYSTRTTL